MLQNNHTSSSASSSRRILTRRSADHTGTPARNPNPTTSTPVQKRREGYSWPLRMHKKHKGLMMTEDSFCTMEDDDDESKVRAENAINGAEKNDDESEPREMAGSVLPVPSWRVMKFSPTKSRQHGEESDDLYRRRHAKLEKLERRLDAELDMEEEMEEHLREQAEQRAKRAINREKMTRETPDVSEVDMEMQSLLPKADNVRFVRVAENLPVTSFGYGLPQMETRDFTRPWKDINEEGAPEDGVNLILPVKKRVSRRGMKT